MNVVKKLLFAVGVLASYFILAAVLAGTIIFLFCALFAAWELLFIFLSSL